MTDFRIGALVDGQAWTGDSFLLLRRDGKFFVRASCDMRGVVTGCLAAVLNFQTLPPVRPIHLFISHDEEVGCAGVKHQLQDLNDSVPRPDFGVAGEPNGTKPILAHKEKFDLDVKVLGLTGHSSEPSKGMNAVHAAGEAIAWIAQEGRRLAVDGPSRRGLIRFITPSMSAP